MRQGDDGFGNGNSHQLRGDDGQPHAQQVAGSLAKTGLRVSEPFHEGILAASGCGAPEQRATFCQGSIGEITHQLLADHIAGQLQLAPGDVMDFHGFCSLPGHS